MSRSKLIVTLLFLMGLTFDVVLYLGADPLPGGDEETPTEADVLSATENGDYKKALDQALLLQRAFPGEARHLGLIGQALAALGDGERALAFFQKYIESLPEEERQLYEDLSLVGSAEELEEISSASPENHAVLLQAFWVRRDMTDTRGLGRKAEHYRRVWYARAFFAESVYPWDKRGEIYIRYGEPEYRGRSGRVNPIPSLAVESIKRRNAYWIYDIGVDRKQGNNPAYVDAAAGYNPDIDNPNFRFRDVTAWSYVEVRADSSYYWKKPSDVEFERWQEPTFPIERGPGGSTRVPWESWVYANIGRGLEIVLVDESHNGRWRFPSMPDTKFPPPMGLISNLGGNHPGPAFEAQVEQFPDFYDLPPGADPLSFYYDAATFRGRGEDTEVEVYLGISPNEVSVRNFEGRSVIQVDYDVSLLGVDGKQGYRTDERLALAVNDTSGSDGGFIPDVSSMEVGPGTYRLAVRVRDRASGKVGVYLQDLEVPSYRDALAMSDLEMAWTVTKARWDGKFRKGDVWVVPMPGRSYRSNQKVYVYYEVYNLQQDSFGATHYQVSYSVHRSQRKSTGMIGALSSGVRRLFSGKKVVVSVSYERSGTEPSEEIYLDLGTHELGTGLFELEVEISDLNQDVIVSRKAMFRIEG